ncbi:hypothetical protein ACFX2H_003724 [Malus domestica]
MFIVESTEDPTYRAVYMLLSQLKDEVDAKIVVAGISTTCSQKIHNQLTHDSHLCPILLSPPPHSHHHLHSLTFLAFLLLQQPHWKEEFLENSFVWAKFDLESESKLASDLMESEKEFPEFKRNLYPDIKPYSYGFLKVLDIHTIYWEQSGNPNGHVSCNSSS